MKAYTLLIIALVLIAGCGDSKLVEETVNPAPETAEPPVVNETPKELPSLEELIEEQKQEEPAAEPGNIVFIEIKNLKFTPADITVPVGTTVVWKHNDQWKEGIEHKITIYYTNPPASSPMMKYGDNYSYTFTEPKKHRYVSVIYKESMVGTITVIE